MDKQTLKNLITKSQHCQRSWDLERSIPEEDIEVLKTAVAQCPTKQNRVFYRPVFITNRDAIMHILETTKSFTIQWEPHEATTNTQVLANCLVVFLRDRDFEESHRTENEHRLGVIDGKNVTLNEGARVDENRAVGLAMGYLVLTSHLLGYRTGIYNTARNTDIVYDMFGRTALLMCGIGYNDPNRNDREHQLDPSFIYPSFEKNVIVEDGDIYTDRILSVDVSKAI